MIETESEINEERLAKLRFLFWKHLGWRQRNEALKLAGIIPESTDKPLPQTIEMTVINAARPWQIRTLWAEVMKFLPKEARIESP